MRYTFSYLAPRQTTVRRLLGKNGVSHRLLAKLYAAQAIQVAGSTTAGNRDVARGQTVTFWLPPDAPVPVSSGALTIVGEWANWLVVDKPAGLASVPGPSNPSDSLVNRVAGYLARAGIEAPQPAVITRLDRDTTGLVLVAKHPFAQGRFDAEKPAITKTYLAVITGELSPAAGRIDAPLGKAADGIHRRVMADGQRAVTDYETIDRGNGRSLVRLSLLTGRTHQIRVHLASLGHPLVGDALYGGDLATADTQQLQATSLRFTDPFTGDDIAVSLPVPPAMKALLGQ